jgi:hypothetical protein
LQREVSQRAVEYRLEALAHRGVASIEKPFLPERHVRDNLGNRVWRSEKGTRGRHEATT